MFKFNDRYFAPNKATMERFKNIVSKEYFRNRIKELFYDARVFVPRMLSRRVGLLDRSLRLLDLLQSCETCHKSGLLRRHWHRTKHEHRSDMDTW